jgi:hypothetical protein
LHRRAVSGRVEQFTPVVVEGVHLVAVFRLG